MTNEYHRSVNELPETFIKGIFTLWSLLVVLAAAIVAWGGVHPAVIAAFAAVCLLPVVTTMVAVFFGRNWPRGRRALFVCLPWILMTAVFVALSGGLSSPALVFAVFPSLFALAFGWRRLAVETAVFSLLATLGAVAVSFALIGLPGRAAAAHASEMFAFAGLCVLPFMIAALVTRQTQLAKAAVRQPRGNTGSQDGPHVEGLEPVGGSDASGMTIIDVTREGRIRSVSGPDIEGLDLRNGRVFIHAFPQHQQARISTRITSGGSFAETMADGRRVEFAVDRHDLGTRVILDDASADVDSQEDAPSETDALKQELVERTAFFAGLGHELKTPLNAILGFSDLMRTELRGPLPEAYKDYAHLIHESGQDLLLIVEDILDYAKSEAGHIRLEVEPVDLTASGESVVAQLSGQAERAGVTLKVMSKREVWAQADPRAIRQIWQNLISNAIKYSNKGGVVTIDARAGQDAVALSVRDTGAGMDAEDLARVARPFQQGSNSKGRAGTGLGLAVVQSFADKMGGKVAIDTAPGEGTRVRVVLPKASASDVTDLFDAAQ